MIEFKDPYETIQQKGRGYRTKGKYYRIHVFSKSIMELGRLCKTFGGNYYPHGSGYLWVFSGEKAVEDMIDTLESEGYLPSVHGFENK